MIKSKIENPLFSAQNILHILNILTVAYNEPLKLQLWFNENLQARNSKLFMLTRKWSTENARHRKIKKSKTIKRIKSLETLFTSHPRSGMSRDYAPAQSDWTRRNSWSSHSVNVFENVCPFKSEKLSKVTSLFTLVLASLELAKIRVHFFKERDWAPV